MDPTPSSQPDRETRAQHHHWPRISLAMGPPHPALASANGNLSIQDFTLRRCNLFRFIQMIIKAPECTHSRTTGADDEMIEFQSDMWRGFHVDGVTMEPVFTYEDSVKE